MQKKDDAARALPKIPLLFLIYGVVGVLAAIALLFICSLLAANEILPESAIQSVPVFVIFIGSVVSGCISAKIMGKAIITGLIQAVVNFAILYLLGIIVFMRINPEGVYVYVFLACVAGAVTGGLLTAVSGGKRRRRAA